MSEEIQKSAEEQLADVVKSEVAAKADKTDLDNFLKAEDHTASVEATKAETDEKIETLKTEINSLIESKFDALPAITKTVKDMNEIMFKDMEIDSAVVKGQEFDTFRKSYSDNTDVNGGRVDTNAPYYILQQANILGRQLGTTIPASGGVVKLPDVNSITWASEAAQPINTSVDGAGGSRIPGGGLTSKNVTIETWVSENAYSMASLEDVPSMDAAITGLMTAQLGRTESVDAVAVLKAATFASGQAITTGVSSGTDRLPTAANVIGVMSNMFEALSSAYTGGSVWAVSRELYGRLQESSNTTLNFDPRMGISTLFGYPVYVIDNLESSGTAGNLVGLFGNFGRGLAMCTSTSMTIGRYDQTRPGAMTYFGRSRFKHAVWDTSALVTLKSGA